MPDSTNTSYFLKLAPLPPSFVGTPQQFAEALVARLRITAPFGITTFLIGGSKPTSNGGPWLKDGNQWWVWDDNAADYVPLDISASTSPVYVISETAPSVFDPPIWFQTLGSRFLNVHVAVNGVWVPLNTGGSGATGARPANPVDFQVFYDTDIEAAIWWERGTWRTLSGVRGDVKFVTWPTSVEALTRNPGWEILGTGEINNPAWRGRVIGQATKDGTLDLSLGAGVTTHLQGATFGEETHALTATENGPHNHKISLETDGTTNGAFNYAKWESSINATPSHPDAENTSTSGDGTPHNNIQPTLALWTLRKT